MVDLKGKVALVVDDELAQIEYISAILDDNHMTAVTASNGIEAMNKLGEAKPDVIILDLMMPEESGMKFFHKLKMKEEYKDIPVIIVSGASQVTGVDLKSIIYDKDFRERKEKVFGIDAAPDAFLEKPVEPDTLMTTIKEYLSS